MSSTDSADESKENSPPKKRQKKSHLSAQEKQMLMNIYKHVNQELYPGELKDKVVEKTSTIAGVSKTTVYKILKEKKDTGTFSPPTQTLRRRRLIEEVDDFDKNAIRRKVHEFFFRNEIPTVDSILNAVNQDEDLPNFKRTTFYNLLKTLNFKYVKRGRDSLLIDRDDITIWRREFLKKIRQFREEGRKIYYTDETWINAAHTKKNIWKHTTVSTSREAFLSGLSTGLKNPSGKGKRLIVCHIGSENGFLQDGLWVFESNKSGDYHEEMNSNSFEQWFTKILPTLKENSVVVMDNAPYHSRRMEKIPTNTKKEDIKVWLTSKNIPFEDNLLKVQLLEIVKEHKTEYNKYFIDELARNQNKIVLRLPPYHCELNPIELIWAQIKNEVAKKNTTFKFGDMKNLFDVAINNVTENDWKRCIKHVVEKVETKMWQLDNIMENRVDQIIINLGEKTTSTESESD